MENDEIAEFCAMSDTDVILLNQAHILFMLGDLLQGKFQSQAEHAWKLSERIGQRQRVIGRPFPKGSF